VVHWLSTLFLLLAAGGLLLPGALQAQGWSAEVHGARSSFDTPPLTSVSTNAALGLRYGRDRRLFGVTAAFPLASDNLLWGALSAGDRWTLRRGRNELGVDLFGQGHVQEDPVTDESGMGLHLQFLPMASTSLGPLVLEARSGGARYRGRIGQEDWSRTLHHSDLTVRVPVRQEGNSSVHLETELRHLRPNAPEDAYTWLGGSATASFGRSRTWISVGRWMEGLDETSSSVGIGGGLGVALSRRLVASAQARRQAFDPLFLGTDRTSWSLGVSYRLGAAAPPPPRAGAEFRGSRQVTIRIPLSESGAPPAVAGDFSGWDPIPMHRRGLNWEVMLELSPGLYHYAFQAEDGSWFVPPQVPGRRDDGMGGWTATLLVPANP
jgi:hypothetical protein